MSFAAAGVKSLVIFPAWTMADIEVMEIEPAKVKLSEKAPMIHASTAKNSNDSLMWVEKYRPAGLEDLLAHEDIVRTLRKLISSNRLPHLLFHGPPGTGKTSTILACAREMYGSSFRSMVLELNASDDRGINVVREQIKSFASTKRIFSTGVKLIILDEADAMTAAAQAALRRVVEQYVRNTRFCLICNYVNKVTPALQSRCTKFRFGPLPTSAARERVVHVVEQEGINLAPDGMEALLELAEGDMRRVLNILQSTHMAVSPEPLTADSFYSNTGEPHPKDLARVFAALSSPDLSFSESAHEVSELRATKGVALSDIIEGLCKLVAKSDMSGPGKIYVYQHLADIEHRLSKGASEKINTAALVGAFAFAGSF